MIPLQNDFQKRTSNLLSSIKLLKSKLTNLLHSQSFDTICKNFKELHCRLTYFLKFAKLARSFTQQVKKILQESITLTLGLNKSYQFEKYGHLFPVMSFIIHKYEQFFGCKVGYNSSVVLRRVTNNQKSDYFKMLLKNQISKEQKIFLNSPNLDPFLKQLADNQVVVQNSQCVCCSQVFIKKFKIYNENPMIRVLTDFNEKKSFDIDMLSLQKHLDAVCNEGGGVLIIGADKQGNGIKATGIRFKSNEQILKKEAQIHESILNIKPNCRFNVERVLVHTNFMDKANIQEEELRLCFRILIFPVDTNKISYIEQVVKGRGAIYETYCANGTQKIVKVQCQQINNLNKKMQSVYTMIHRKYKSRLSIVNSHEGINCFRPYQYYSKVFQTYMEEGKTKKEQKSIEPQNQNLYNDEPKFKYTFASLLVVTSKKNQRWIQELSQKLSQKKKIFQTSKPFANSITSSGRLAFLMTHEMSCQDLKNLIKMLQNQGKIKRGAIRMMPVGKNLQIERKNFKQYHQQRLRQRFMERYKEGFLMEVDFVSNHTEKIEYIFLFFNDLSQSIFAYMVLEQFSLKPYFINDGNTYKKKDKLLYSDM